MATVTKPAASGGIRGGRRLTIVDRAALAVLLISGAAQLVLGSVIWTGQADQLITIHIAVGVLVVLSLGTLAANAARVGVSIGLVLAAVAWGLIAAVFGLAQDSVLEGDWHWTVEVVHLLIGVGVIACGLVLAASMREVSR